MEFIRNWMKEFLIIYLILTILMHLSAGEQYKKYLRFFSGVILLAVLVSPVVRLFGSSEGKRKLSSYYEEFWEELDSTKQESLKMNTFTDSRMIHKYESAAEEDIKNSARSLGAAVSSVRVQISDDYEIEKITVWMDQQQDSWYQGQRNGENIQEKLSVEADAEAENPNAGAENPNIGEGEADSGKKRQGSSERSQGGETDQQDYEESRLAAYLMETYGLEEEKLLFY